MKYIKKFENLSAEDIFYNKFNRKKYKKYIVTRDEDGDMFLDEIVKINETGNSVFVKDLFYFNVNKNEITKETSHSDNYLIYLNSMIYTSDDYNKAYDFFIKESELSYNTKKYNL